MNRGEGMSEQIQDWLSEAVHNSEHLETVSKRMLDFQTSKQGLYSKNKEMTINGFRIFYEYIAQDHNLYGAPEGLLEAAKASTHYFHGVIHVALFHDHQDTAYTYSLMIAYHNRIDNMTNADSALDLTIEIIDSYFDYLVIVGKLQLGEFSEKVITLIDLNIEKPMSTQMIADLLNLNSDYLGRKIKEETGKTITQLIYIRKTDLAKFYLEHTNLPINQISDNLGFETASYFGKVFKKYTGLTPNIFKKKQILLKDKIGKI